MIHFQYGEVLESDHTYKYKNSDNQKTTNSLFAIKVRVYGDLYKDDIFYARPLDITTKKIPVVGEHVLLIAGPDETSQNKSNGGLGTVWYYVSTFSIQSSISHNMLPGVSGVLSQDEIDNMLPGQTFDKNVSTSPLQPYEGDTINEGRHGNSIRLGSTCKQDETRYNIQPTWTGDSVNDPIIILSNTSERPAEDDKDKKQFIVENIQTDDSSLYLTSKQKLSEFTLSEPITKATSESSFEESQLIGVANRVILKAKTDIIALDSKKMVTINTPELKLGDDTADESMVHGDELATLLKQLISTIRSGTSGGGLISTFDNSTQRKFNKLIKRVENIKSSKFKLKKL